MPRYSIRLVLCSFLVWSCSGSEEKSSELPLHESVNKGDTPTVQEPIESNDALEAKRKVARLAMVKLVAAYPYWTMETGEMCPTRIEDLYPYFDANEEVDPWGEKYLVACGEEVTTVLGFGVLSRGPDGRLNTDDDLRSWDESLVPADDRKLAETSKAITKRTPVLFCGQEFDPYTRVISCYEDVTNLGPLARLTNVDELRLAGPQLSGISGISTLSRLTKLSLDGTSVENLSPLANLTNLRELKLARTYVKDLSPLAKLTKLRHLSLGRNRSRLVDIGPLAALTNLTYLNLALTHVQHIGPLSKLVNLQSLRLKGTQVKDLGPLTKLSKLVELSVGADFSRAQIEALQVALPNLEIVR